MKRLLFALLAVLAVANFSYGYCVFVTWSPLIIQENTKVTAIIEKGFATINENTMEFLLELKKQKALLEKENELLTEYSSVLANKLKQEKEIVFLMEKYNKLLGNKIDQRSIE